MEIHISHNCPAFWKHTIPSVVDTNFIIKKTKGQTPITPIVGSEKPTKDDYFATISIIFSTLDDLIK